MNSIGEHKVNADIEHLAEFMCMVEMKMTFFMSVTPARTHSGS